MANEQDEVNANGWNGSDASSHNNSGKAAGSGNTDFRPADTPKENPFSFKHFLRSDTSSNSTLNHSQSNTNIVNGNEVNTGSSGSNSNSTQSPSKSATTSSLNSTGARPKIPQFQSVSAIQNQQDSRMKRSPKFSSFDSQSSLSELADERIHGSRSNNSFNMDYQFPSSRSYSNYDIEPSSASDRKQSERRSFAQRTQNNNSSNSILPDFLSDGLQDHMYYDNPSANMSPLSGDDFSLGNNNSMNIQNGFDLTFNRSPPSNRRRNNHQSIPLDLPLTHRSVTNDLPPDLMNGSDVAVQREETYGPHNEPEITRDQAAIDKMQTLPDFLSDGLIHSSGRLADVATVTHEEDNQSIFRLQQENDRLRMIIIDMENQISQAKNLETQYNVTLVESMEQVEENLFASNQRAAEAQAQANKYKQQVKQLTADVQRLRLENEVMRDGGAIGGVGTSTKKSTNAHLAKDLRKAAASAESNLRQLLSGVENLRLIAQNIERSEQPSNLDYLSDELDDLNEGPAL